MAHEPSTHRQDEDAQDAAGSAGEPERSDAGRRNNAALVTEPKLLHFGLDYLRLCLGEGKSMNSRSLKFLSSIFSQPHNDSNASAYKDFVWADTDEDVDLLFGKTQHGEGCYVSSDGWVIMGIERISEESSFYKNIRGKYQYVVNFYGAFFGLIKLGLDPAKFWNIFDVDIRNSSVVHCLSRIDICADVSDIDVLKVSKGINVLSSAHAKPFTTINVDWETNIPQTFNYGSSEDKRWHARIYNKIKDMERKKTEALYPNYWGLNCITRIELELHEVCREFRINFLNCRDVNFQFSIFKTLLETKYVQLSILPFLIKQMETKGVDYFSLQRVQPNYNEMPNLLFYKRTLRKNLACRERMRMPLDIFLARIKRDMEKELSFAPSKNA